MPEETNNRRRFHRVATDKTVSLQVDNERHSGIVLDISFRGLLLEVDGDWAPEIGKPAQAHVLLDEQTPGITLDGEVAHVDGRRIGLRCVSIDLDSAGMLRRMVELNLSDGQLLERELSQLISG